MDWATFFGTAWHQAMLAMLLLFIAHRRNMGRWPVHRIRTWVALFGASLAAWLVTPRYGVTPFFAYALICLVAAWIVSIKHDGIPQRAIAIIFGGMAAVHGGLYFTGQPNGGDAYVEVMQIAGWAQFAILFFWGFKNVGLGTFVRRRVHRMGHHAGGPASVGNTQP